MTKAADLPLEVFVDQDAWRNWLAANGSRSDGIRLQIAKAGSCETSVSYAEAVEVALAHGWIDGQKGRIDEAWWWQLFGPRRARSPWSRINRDKAEALIASGAMTAEGLKEVERAKADGRWEGAYAGSRTMATPDDLASALGASPHARAAFDALDSANRYAILWRLHQAKRPETRARRLAEFIAMLERGETLHPPRQVRRRD